MHGLQQTIDLFGSRHKSKARRSGRSRSEPRMEMTPEFKCLAAGNGSDDQVELVLISCRERRRAGLGTRNVAQLLREACDILIVKPDLGMRTLELFAAYLDGTDLRIASLMAARKVDFDDAGFAVHLILVAV